MLSKPIVPSVLLGLLQMPSTAHALHLGSGTPSKQPNVIGTDMAVNCAKRMLSELKDLKHPDISGVGLYMDGDSKAYMYTVQGDNNKAATLTHVELKSGKEVPMNDEEKKNVRKTLDKALDEAREKAEKEKKEREEAEKAGKKAKNGQPGSMKTYEIEADTKAGTKKYLEIPFPEEYRVKGLLIWDTKRDIITIQIYDERPMMLVKVLQVKDGSPRLASKMSSLFASVGTGFVKIFDEAVDAFYDEEILPKLGELLAFKRDEASPVHEHDNASPVLKHDEEPLPRHRKNSAERDQVSTVLKRGDKETKCKTE